MIAKELLERLEKVVYLDSNFEIKVRDDSGNLREIQSVVIRYWDEQYGPGEAEITLVEKKSWE